MSRVSCGASLGGNLHQRQTSALKMRFTHLFMILGLGGLMSDTSFLEDAGNHLRWPFRRLQLYYQAQRSKNENKTRTCGGVSCWKRTASTTKREHRTPESTHHSWLAQTRRRPIYNSEPRRKRSQSARLAVCTDSEGDKTCLEQLSANVTGRNRRGDSRGLREGGELEQFSSSILTQNPEEVARCLHCVAAGDCEIVYEGVRKAENVDGVQREYYQPRHERTPVKTLWRAAEGPYPLVERGCETVKKPPPNAVALHVEHADNQRKGGEKTAINRSRKAQKELKRAAGLIDTNEGGSRRRTGKSAALDVIERPKGESNISLEAQGRDSWMHRRQRWKGRVKSVLVEADEGSDYLAGVNSTNVGRSVTYAAAPNRNGKGTHSLKMKIEEPFLKTAANVLRRITAAVPEHVSKYTQGTKESDKARRRLHPKSATYLFTTAVGSAAGPTGEGRDYETVRGINVAATDDAEKAQARTAITAASPLSRTNASRPNRCAGANRQVIEGYQRETRAHKDYEGEKSSQMEAWGTPCRLSKAQICHDGPADVADDDVRSLALEVEAHNATEKTNQQHVEKGPHTTGFSRERHEILVHCSRNIEALCQQSEASTSEKKIQKFSLPDTRAGEEHEDGHDCAGYLKALCMPQVAFKTSIAVEEKMDTSRKAAFSEVDQPQRDGTPRQTRRQKIQDSDSYSASYVTEANVKAADVAHRARAGFLADEKESSALFDHKDPCGTDKRYKGKGGAWKGADGKKSRRARENEGGNPQIEQGLKNLTEAQGEIEAKQEQVRRIGIDRALPAILKQTEARRQSSESEGEQREAAQEKGRRGGEKRNATAQGRLRRSRETRWCRKIEVDSKTLLGTPVFLLGKEGDYAHLEEEENKTKVKGEAEAEQERLRCTRTEGIPPGVQKQTEETRQSSDSEREKARVSGEQDRRRGVKKWTPVQGRVKPPRETRPRWKTELDTKALIKVSPSSPASPRKYQGEDASDSPLSSPWSTPPYGSQDARQVYKVPLSVLNDLLLRRPDISNVEVGIARAVYFDPPSPPRQDSEHYRTQLYQDTSNSGKAVGCARTAVSTPAATCHAVKKAAEYFKDYDLGKNQARETCERSLRGDHNQELTTSSQ